jgi:hypothetical protein
LLEYFGAKVRGEVIFEPTVGKVSIHDTNNDSEFRVVNFAA